MGKVVQVIDKESGLLISTRSYEDKVNTYGDIKATQYIRIGREAITKLTPIEVTIGSYIAFIVETNTNSFIMSKEFKKYVTESLGIGRVRYYQLISQLKEKKVIYPLLEAKTYMVNPRMFCRCKTLTRNKLIDKYNKLAYRMLDIAEKELLIDSNEVV
jgi:hypothetical protein